MAIDMLITVADVLRSLTMAGMEGRKDADENAVQEQGARFSIARSLQNEVAELTSQYGGERYGDNDQRLAPFGEPVVHPLGVFVRLDNDLASAPDASLLVNDSTFPRFLIVIFQNLALAPHNDLSRATHRAGARLDPPEPTTSSIRVFLLRVPRAGPSEIEVCQG